MRLTEDEREQKDEQHLEVRRYNSGHSIRQAHIGLDIGGRFTEGICFCDRAISRSLASLGMTVTLYAPRSTPTVRAEKCFIGVVGLAPQKKAIRMQRI